MADSQLMGRYRDDIEALHVLRNPMNERGETNEEMLAGAARLVQHLSPDQALAWVRPWLALVDEPAILEDKVAPRCDDVLSPWYKVRVNRMGRGHEGVQLLREYRPIIVDGSFAHPSATLLLRAYCAQFEGVALNKVMFHCGHMMHCRHELHLITSRRFDDLTHLMRTRTDWFEISNFMTDLALWQGEYVVPALRAMLDGRIVFSNGHFWHQVTRRTGRRAAEIFEMMYRRNLEMHRFEWALRGAVSNPDCAHECLRVLMRVLNDNDWTEVPYSNGVFNAALGHRNSAIVLRSLLDGSLGHTFQLDHVPSRHYQIVDTSYLNAGERNIIDTIWTKTARGDSATKNIRLMMTDLTLSAALGRPSAEVQRAMCREAAGSNLDTLRCLRNGTLGDRFEWDNETLVAAAGRGEPGVALRLILGGTLGQAPCD